MTTSASQVRVGFRFLLPFEPPHLSRRAMRKRIPLEIGPPRCRQGGVDDQDSLHLARVFCATPALIPAHDRAGRRGRSRDARKGCSERQTDY